MGFGQVVFTFGGHVGIHALRVQFQIMVDAFSRGVGKGLLPVDGVDELCTAGRMERVGVLVEESLQCGPVALACLGPFGLLGLYLLEPCFHLFLVLAQGEVGQELLKEDRLGQVFQRFVAFLFHAHFVLQKVVIVTAHRCAAGHQQEKGHSGGTPCRAVPVLTLMRVMRGGLLGRWRTGGRGFLGRWCLFAAIRAFAVSVEIVGATVFTVYQVTVDGHAAGGACAGHCRYAVPAFGTFYHAHDGRCVCVVSMLLH